MMYGINSFANALASSTYTSIPPSPSSSFPNHAQLRKQISNSLHPTRLSPSTARITHSLSINASVKNSWHFHPTNFMQNGRVHPPSYFSLAPHETNTSNRGFQPNPFSLILNHYIIKPQIRVHTSGLTSWHSVLGRAEKKADEASFLISRRVQE